MPKTKEALQWNQDKNPFQEDIDSFHAYIQYSVNVGPSTKTGIFYRRVAEKYENQLVNQLDTILEESGVAHFSFNDIREKFRSIPSYARPMEIISRIISKGKKLIGENADMEDILVSGATAINESLLPPKTKT